MIKILHTGDVHLDSPFAGFSAAEAAKRRLELRETFSSMMAYARSAAVDMVLIAGDLLDRRFATADTLRLIKDELSSLDCPVVIAPGNHDPADGKGIWQKENFSDNVYIFREDKLSYFSFDSLGVDVYGYAFTSSEMTSSPVSGEFVRDRSRINILLCHGDLTSPVSTSAPISRAQIDAFGANYTALGHIHNGEDYSGSIGGRVFAYCGCPEGRDFGECGSKGAVICEIDRIAGDVHVSVKRKVFCRKIYKDAEVHVDGAVSSSEVCLAAKKAAEGSDSRTALRLTFTGTVSPELVIDEAAVRAAVGDVESLTVRDKTVPSLAFSENDPTVKGEYCRLLAPLLGSADPEERERAVRALRLGLAALSGSDI